MQSLTAIMIVASFFTNLQYFHEDPVGFQDDLYMGINKTIAALVLQNTNSDNIGDQQAIPGTDIIAGVLGETTVNNGDNVTSNGLVLNTQLNEAALKTAPPPTPTQTPMPKFDNFDVVGAVERAANEYGVDMDLMKRIATCESNFNAYAHNKRYDYAGLFQFHKNTWIITRQRMGLDTDPILRFSAEEAARTAAFKILHDGPGAWSGCL